MYSHITTLFVLGIATLGHRVLGQHYVQQTITKNPQHDNPNLKQVFINEDLFQQFKQWQQLQEQQTNFDNTLHETKNSYGGNPWLPPTTKAPYLGVNPAHGNYWTNPPQNYPVQTSPPPVQSGGGGYYPSQPPVQSGSGGGYYPTVQPPVQSGSGGGYYPVQTPKPPVQGGYYPEPPTQGGWIPPPDTPEVASLRKYCLKPRGQFPSKSCNKYVNCWDDSIVEQECPSGLLFSDKGYCDYDYNVDCNGRNVGPVAPPATMPPQEGKCPTLFGNYRSKANCSEFFVCNHGIPIKFCCPAGLYYSTELGVCDYPYNVDCINPRPLHPESVPVGPSQEIPTPVWINNNPYHVERVHSDLVDQGKQCIPNSVYRLSEDCSTVAICRSHGRTEVVKCGFQTAFDIERGTCVAKHLALC